MQNNKNIQPKNKNGKAHGYWKLYWRQTNKLWYKCSYVNGIVYGYGQNTINKLYYAR